MLFKKKFRIESIRLPGFDYSSHGYYFITICTKNRLKYFGEIRSGKMQLNNMGEIAAQVWKEIPSHFNNVYLYQYVIMPDHIHGIIVINKNPIIAKKRNDSGICGENDIRTNTDQIDASDHGIFDGNDIRNMIDHIDGMDRGRDEAVPRLYGRPLSVDDLILGKNTISAKINKPFSAADFIFGENTIHANIRTPLSENVTVVYEKSKSATISSIIGSYKSICTKTINKLNPDNHFGWQKGFHEHIIRDQDALQRIRRYIRNNPHEVKDHLQIYTDSI